MPNAAATRNFTYVYDVNTGRKLSEKDVENSIETTYTYDDLNRVTSTVVEGTGSLKSKTIITYDDANRAVRTAA